MPWFCILVLMLAMCLSLGCAQKTVAADADDAEPKSDPPRPLKVAALVTAYYHNSHADVIVSRLMQTDTLDGKGRTYPLELVSLYTDQVPDNDISRRLAKEHNVPIFDTIEGALTLGAEQLAVDAVLLVAEHGKYPKSESGNTQYPKRRFFEETIAVFQRSGRVVPVFIDKHVADNWQDITFIHDTAAEMNIPLMAGSSLPVLWRKPAADVPRDAKLRQIVAISYHTLDHYGFHALEFTQALAERREGGETGIEAVRCLAGDAVWRALDTIVDKQLFEQAMARLPRTIHGNRPMREAAQDPTLFILEYADGLRAYIFTLNGVVGEWSAAWRYHDGDTESTHFWTQEARPFMHFTYLLNGVEQMFLTGKPAWPVERTVLTSGALDELLRSRLDDGKRRPTPHLMIEYTSDWDWQQPPDSPPGRPMHGQ